jgi:hypothetical protein
MSQRTATEASRTAKADSSTPGISLLPYDTRAIESRITWGRPDRRSQRLGATKDRAPEQRDGVAEHAASLLFQRDAVALGPHAQTFSNPIV